MTSREFAIRLERRARRADVLVPAQAVLKLEEYYRLLARWNSKINLTALSLSGAPDHTLDRLIIEPIAAARYVPDAEIRWFDLGSGGGSPAIPLKIVRPTAHLTMVEAKARKAAFLREAVRELDLSNTRVENSRYEELEHRSELRGVAGLVTVRAVKLDQALFKVAGFLLAPAGTIHLYRSETLRLAPQPDFCVTAEHRLAETLSSRLVVLQHG